MPIIDEFFAELDAQWPWSVDAPVELRIIGSAALMLQASYDRGTKDGDVLETRELVPTIKQRLLDLAGPGTEIHRRRGIYVDVVAGGIPFLPQRPRWHPLNELNHSLAHFRLYALDVVDVVVSKLKRLSANDASDIEAMVERGLVQHDDLAARFREAVDYFACDARAEDLPRYVANLHRVERDMLGVAETPIELPAWI